MRMVAGILGMIFFLGANSLTMAQVRVMPGEIEDSRRTDGFFNKLQIELKLIGDILDEARAVRVRVKSAVDETGRDLMPAKEEDDSFEEFSQSSGGGSKIKIELKNPARQATVVRDISGTVELFIPRRDPASTVAIRDISKKTGTPLVEPQLKAQGVEIIIWTKEQFEARKKAEEARLRKEAEARKKEAAQELGEEMVEGLMKVFGGLFNAFTEMDENSIALQITDPQSKIANMEFEDATGKAISYQGRSSMGDNPKTVIYGFENKLPETARIKIYLLTPKSLVTTPFKLTNVPLP